MFFLFSVFLYISFFPFFLFLSVSLLPYHIVTAYNKMRERKREREREREELQMQCSQVNAELIWPSIAFGMAEIA